MQVNYFEFYGLEPALTLDAGKVRQIYLEKSRQYHPDYHTQATEAEQEKALELSSLNNEAYKTLSNPDKLLGYVLQQQGLLSEEAGNEKMPQAFLMEMMEINEALMELEFDPDPNAVEKATKQIEEIENKLEDSIKNIRNNWTADSGNTKDLESVKEYFLKKKYLLRVKEKLSTFATAF